MEFITTQKYIRTSPRKLQVVAGMVRKLTPVQAVERLPFSGKRAGQPLAKAITVAIANAKQKGISDSELIFKEIQINQGPKMKRFRAGSRGRAKPYERIMSHIRVVLTTKPSVEKKTEGEKVDRTKKEKEVKVNLKVKTKSSKAKPKTNKK